MSKNKLEEINKLIEDKKISEAEFEISKLGSEFFKNVDYLYLRSKIFFGNVLACFCARPLRFSISSPSLHLGLSF